MGTYWVTRIDPNPRGRTGAQYAAMGTPFHVPYSVPMEMRGFDLVGGQGFLWSDLSAKPGGASAALQSLRYSSWRVGAARPVAKTIAEFPGSRMERGATVQERRILWINDVAPGQYALGLILKAPGTSILPFRVKRRACPDCAVKLDVPVLVVPAALRDSLPQPNGR